MSKFLIFSFINFESPTNLILVFFCNLFNFSDVVKKIPRYFQSDSFNLVNKLKFSNDKMVKTALALYVLEISKLRSNVFRIY